MISSMIRIYPQDPTTLANIPFGLATHTYIFRTAERLLQIDEVFQPSSAGPLISWKSRKQQTVVLSTCEAEYVALANAVQEAKFVNQLCKD